MLDITSRSSSSSRTERDLIYDMESPANAIGSIYLLPALCILVRICISLTIIPIQKKNMLTMIIPIILERSYLEECNSPYDSNCL